VNDILLGEILFEQKILTRDELARALGQQLKTGLPLGKCIVALDLAPEGQVQKAIDLQEGIREWRAVPPFLDARRARNSKLDPVTSTRQGRFIEAMNAYLLGQILIRLGTITPEQLDRALQIQIATGIRIGEALVEIGAATWDQIRVAVKVQGDLRQRP
jgi:hypothetical protein